MLCCIYLDGLGCRLAPFSMGSAQSFSELLMHRSEESPLGLILPHRLADKLKWKSLTPDFRAEVEPALRDLPATELLTEAELLDALSNCERHMQGVRANAWRGSVASVVYERLRSLAVHDLGSSGGLEFGTMTHLGRRLPAIDFNMLHRSLERIVTRVRTDSETPSAGFVFP